MDVEPSAPFDAYLTPHECRNCTSVLTDAVRVVLKHHPDIREDAVAMWSEDNFFDFMMKMVSSLSLKDVLSSSSSSSSQSSSSSAQQGSNGAPPRSPDIVVVGGGGSGGGSGGGGGDKGKGAQISDEDRAKARQIMDFTQISEGDAILLLKNHPSGGAVEPIINDFLIGNIDMDYYRKLEDINEIEFSEEASFGLGEADLMRAKNLLQLIGTDKYSPDDICCLLRHHPNSRDIGAVLTTLQQGVDMKVWREKDEVLLRKSIEPKEVECVFCFDEFKIEDMFTLDCEHAHRFCFECIERHMEISIKDGIPPTCPGQECTHKITSLEVSQIFGNGELYNKFNQLVLKRALEGLEGSVGCPSPGCSNYIVVDTSKKVRCTCPGCGLVFCSMCRERYHYGDHTCAEMKGLQLRWMQWNLKDRQQAHSREQKQALENRKKELKRRMEELKKDEEWKEKNLRLCPKCSRAIEKTGGCNAMVCGRDTHGNNVQDGCGHKFQWTSARPYKKMKWDDALKNVDQNQISSDDINKVRTSHGLWHCDVCPNHDRIMGIRFSCLHCPSFNICQDCEEKGEFHHHPDHVFDIIHKEKYDVDMVDLR